MIQGPVTGGKRGYAFGRPLFDLKAHGYVEEEFFLSGTATTWQQVAGSAWDRDGRWKVEPKANVPFKTRLLVYRPADAKRFNGTVIVSWNNVTAGYELFGGESGEILEGGYAFVGATVQRVGVHGFPQANQGLAAWDPERYGTLSIPTDDASFDIYTQVARAVGAERDRSGTDPLGGLDVRKVVALGASQSAARLATYVNAVHPLARAFDGYLLQIYFGRGTPIEVGTAIRNIDWTARFESTTLPATLREIGLFGDNLIRDDLDVPVMVVNSELEAVACHNVRQPDTDRFRYWESAGTSHTAKQSQDIRAAKYQREFCSTQPVLDDMNRIPLAHYYDAAIHHMNRWVNGGEPPPRQPLIEFAGGNSADVVRDAHGIAKGGVRLPQVEAPVAQNSALLLEPTRGLLLRGSNHPFDAATLRSLYRDEADYRTKFTQAAQRAVQAGTMLSRDVAPALDEAMREYRRALEYAPVQRREARAVAGTRMRQVTRTAAATLCALSLVIGSARADDPKIEPGQWQVTQKNVVNGAAAQPTVRARCITPEQAGDLNKTFGPAVGTINSTCKPPEIETSGKKLRWKLECRGQMDMAVVGEFDFDSPTHYTATIASKAWMAGSLISEVTTDVEAEHIGTACQP